MGLMDQSVNKVDNFEKLSGEACYINDMVFENMYYVKTVRSAKAKARIVSLELPQLPQDYQVVTYRDIPGKNVVRIIDADMPVLARDQVNYIGEPILLIVGPSKKVIQEIFRDVRITYEEAAGVADIDAAIGADAFPVAYTYEKGDVEAAFASADRVITQQYETGYQEHVYIEPQGMIGRFEGGRAEVFGSLQCPYYVKDALMDALNLGPEQVRVVQTTTGGAFGGKEEYPSLIGIHAALAAMKSGHPAKLIFDRREDMEASTKRHPSRIIYRTAIKAGRISAFDVSIFLDGGAYTGLSSVVLQRAMIACCGVYSIPNVRVAGRVCRTNKVPTGAFRGFGAPQVLFALEACMAHLAKTLGQDSLDFKLSHLAKQGDMTATQGTFRDPIVMESMIDKVMAMSNYREKRKRFKEAGLTQGIGISLFLHGCGFTGSAEQDHIKSVVRLVKEGEARVRILIANVDMGQGLKTAMRKIVAENLGLPMENIFLDNPDTDIVPNSGPTVASRTTMIVGGLVDLAAKEMKARWMEDAHFEVVQHYRQPDYIRWDMERFAGDAYPGYSWGVNVVEAEVDPVTLESSLKGIWAVFDIGRAIDARLMKGQIEGGILQGIGYGMMERMDAREGRLMQSTLADYQIPTAMDTVVIESALMDNPFQLGPYGAKGAGELTLLGGAPAVALAIENAFENGLADVRIRQIPVTPEYLLTLLEEVNG